VDHELCSTRSSKKEKKGPKFGENCHEPEYGGEKGSRKYAAPRVFVGERHWGGGGKRTTHPRAYGEKKVGALSEQEREGNSNTGAPLF